MSLQLWICTLTGFVNRVNKLENSLLPSPIFFTTRSTSTTAPPRISHNTSATSSIRFDLLSYLTYSTLAFPTLSTGLKLSCFMKLTTPQPPPQPQPQHLCYLCNYPQSTLIFCLHYTHFPYLVDSSKTQLFHEAYPRHCLKALTFTSGCVNNFPYESSYLALGLGNFLHANPHIWLSNLETFCIRVLTFGSRT